VNPRSHVPRKSEYQRTDVRRGVTVGANATVLCGHELGEYCFVAAGAVVTRDVQPFALVAGVPARVIGWMCRCGVRLPLGRALHDEVRVTCEACGTGYLAEDGGLRLAESSARV
jgi:UDP-2-acetamido-3-amino-2,3-dideoxy-glucuronate N-acetyltransferase